MQEILEKHKKILVNHGDIKHPVTNARTKGWSITPKGWEVLEQPVNIESNTGFIAMSFNSCIDI